jgi:hypothetical protein
VLWLFSILLLIFMAPVWAACPRDTGKPLPPREELPALDRELVSYEAECSRDAPYLAYRGAVLNGLGKYVEAASLLEGALLLEPDLAGAQLDYAEALAGLGETVAAMSLFRDVLARPDVPPDTRAYIVRRLNTLDIVQRFDALVGLRSVGENWHGVASVTLKGGYDTNLNSAPSRSTLGLTLPGGEELVFALAENVRARGGAAGIGEFRGNIARRFEGGGSLQVYGEARARFSGSSSTTDTDYQQGQLVGAWTQPLVSGDAFFSLGGTRLHYGGDDLYSAIRLTAGRDWSYQPCQPRLGFEGELRRYPVARELDGRFYSLATGVACKLGANRLFAAARAGVDAAERDRPGGDQRHVDLRLAWVGTLGPGSILVDLLLAHQRDATGYSPLLEDNATRRLYRANLYLEYVYPVSTSWALVGSVEGSFQRSNLPLFDVSGQAVYLGIRWQTPR